MIMALSTFLEFLELAIEMKRESTPQKARPILVSNILVYYAYAKSWPNAISEI